MILETLSVLQALNVLGVIVLICTEASERQSATGGPILFASGGVPQHTIVALDFYIID